ncbi:MAG: hypothetical protein JWR83_2261 [Aeromicrobium sp.]|nr:hypothetical protein [Aeromicrobium sp.]
MPFANPHVCPNCAGAIAGEAMCPHCLFDLNSEPARQLWQTLLHADQLLEQARYVPTGQPVAAQETPAEPAPTPAPSVARGAYPTYPAAPPPQAAAPVATPAKDRSWSVGTILLVLGAFGLIVAGLIFITRSWGDLGLAGRTLILLGVTIVIGALGVWVTRRPLRASAEAVWTVFLALLTLDFFAGRHENLLGLRQVEIAWAWIAWGALLLALCVLIAVLSRRTLKADLVATSIVGGFAMTIAGIGAGGVNDGWDLSWQAFLALLVVGALGLATRPAKLRALTITARVVVGGFFLFAYVVAAVELFDNPSLKELTSGRHGLPMLLMTAASFAVATAVPPVRIPAVALAVLSICALIITPSAEAWTPEGTWLSVAVLAVAFAVPASRGTSDWIRGVRYGALPVVAGIGLLHLGLLIDVFDAIGRAFDQPWKGAWDGRLHIAAAEQTATWPVLIVLGALLVTTWFVLRWPEAARAKVYASSILAVTAGVGLVDAVVGTRPPLWVGVAVLVVAAVVALGAHRRELTVLAGPVAAGLVGFASLLSVSNQSVSSAAWTAGALVLAGLVAPKGETWLRQGYAVVAVGLLVGGVAAFVDVVDAPRAATALVALVLALEVLAVAGLWWRTDAVRIPVEIAAGVAGLLALIAEGSSSELAVRWTIAGVVLIALSFVIKDRQLYLWPGIAALIVAYVLLIVHSGFSFVEAYTLPLGAGALGVGLFLTRRHASQSTWLLLGPGLALALLPSVPQALADPTGLRALLLGLGALVALVVGTRLGWQLPFVVGVAILAALVLFNIGPYANAAPRVVLIALVSAVLLGVGITWEDRVRDSRKLVTYVRSMR